MKTRLSGIVVSLICTFFSLSAMADTQLVDSLKDSLKAQGWQPSESEDGSLIYRHGDGSNKNPAESKTVSVKQNNTKLVKALQSKGWDASWKDDGSLVLHPKSPKETVTVKKAVTTVSIPDLSGFEYWRVSKAADGSMVFRPVDKASITENETAAAGSQPCTEDATEAAKFDLPIDQWEEVYELAQDWLKGSGLSGLMVGTSRPVRRYQWFHLVNLVSDHPPYLIRYQIAIRASDGKVVKLR